jgi:hypothetical protein
MENETLTNAAYWAEFENKWQDLLQNSEDPEVKNFADDMLALGDSIADQRQFALSSLERFSKMEEDARIAIQSAQEVLDNIEKARASVVSDIKEVCKDNLPELEEFLEEKGFGLDSIAMKNSQEQALRDAAKKAVAKHPVKYLISQMKDAISQVHEAVNYTKLSEENYKNVLEKAAETALTTMGSLYAPIKSSVLETMHSSAIAAGAITNNAYDKLSDITNRNISALKKGVASLTKGCNIVLEAVTAGAWSHFCKAVVNKAAAYVAKKENLELSDADLEVMAKTNPDYAKAVEDILENSKKGLTLGAIAYHVVSLTYKVAGRTPAFQEVDGKMQETSFNDYWTSIKEGLWKGGRSPVELAFAAGEKVAKFGKEAPEKIKNAVTEATKKAYDKAEAVAVQTAESLKQDLCIGAATVLELQAEVAEKTANLMEKLETRNAIKISKLEEVDKSVFESMQAIKKEMHSLTEITPFQKADYVPDPQITNEIQKLKQLAPDSTINFAIKLYEDTLKKQETLYHKTQAKAEKKVNKQVETKKDSLTADYFKLYGKQTENLAKIEKSLNRLDKIASAREAVLDFSKDLTNSAKELTQNTGKKAEVEAEAERE